MSDIADSSQATREAGVSLRRCLGAGLHVGMMGSALFALIEIVERAVLMREYFSGILRPWTLVAASYGMMAISHVLLWIPLMMLSGAVYKLIRRRSPRAAVEPFLVGLIVILAGIWLVPMAVRLANVKSYWVIMTSRLLAIAVAIGCYALGRVMYRRLGPVRFRKLVRVGSLVSFLMIVSSGIIFYRSLFFNPSAYRVPRAKQSNQANVEPGLPNILWIDLDTVRADRLSCYGYEKKTTPFLEEWANQSIVFDRAVSDGNWTLPAHASMFTGMSVRQHGVDWGHLHLDDDQTTIAERLSESGYHTVFLSNNPWLIDGTKVLKGFQSVCVVHEQKRLGHFSFALLAEEWGLTPRLPWLDRDFGASLSNLLASQWLDEHANHDAPLFLFVNYMEAHLPFRIPKNYRKHYMNGRQVDRSYDLRRKVYGGLIQALDFYYNVNGGQFLLRQDRDILRLQYDAAIRYLDDRIRELIGMFDQRGMLENTLVILTSDHGEYLGTHKMWGHRFQVYDDSSHVLLMLREPGRKKGVRIETPVQQSDLHETIIHAVLGQTPAGLGPHSRDLFALAASGEEQRIAVCQYTRAGILTYKQLINSNNPELRHRAVGQWGVTDGRYKYIASKDGRRELYDLDNDPGELRNLISTHPGPTKRLSDYLSAWKDLVPGYVPKKNASATPLKPSTIDALKSLGYIDAGD